MGEIEEIQDLTLDDMFEQAERKSAKDMLGEITGELTAWLEDDEMSFKKFEDNRIIGIDGKDFRARLIYYNDPDAMCTQHSATTLPMCAASIKSLGYMIDDIRKDNERSLDTTNLLIYGHVMDYDDEFGSRLDDKMVNAFPDDFVTKVDSVELSGAFASVEDMRNVIMTLYKRLTKQTFQSKILLHLDSTVRDDQGMERTVADLIHSGYIEQTVVRIPNVVEYVFRILDHSYTDVLYTKDYEEAGKLVL